MNIPYRIISFHQLNYRVLFKYYCPIMTGIKFRSLFQLFNRIHDGFRSDLAIAGQYPHFTGFYVPND